MDFTQPTDQQALALTHAIALAESGQNGQPNYNAVGDAGTSKGAYQWQPGNFEAAAKNAGLNPNDFSSKNQDMVAYSEIKAYKDKGYDPGQIASIWNSGSPNNWQNHSGTTTINGQPISYDTPTYVKKVQGYYQQLLPQSQNAQIHGSVTPPIAPPIGQNPDQPSVDTSSLGSGILGALGGIGSTLGNIAKSATEPIATTLAMPYEAAHELIGGETDPAKLGNVPLLSSIYGQFPVPNNAGDVEKQLGRSIETVAFGLNPVAGGAAFGLGGSLEQGNPLLSAQTGLRTAGGALLGKGVEAAAPYVSKVAGALTPQFAKDAATKVGEAISPISNAISGFAKNTKIIPDMASNAINTGADAINNAPGMLASLIKSQYGGSSALAGNSEKALQSQVESEIQKAIGVSGKKSAGVLAGIGIKMRQGAETLFDESPALTVTDELGNQIPYNPTTATLSQHVQALDQAKDNLYADLEKNLTSATKGGVTIDTSDAINKLKSVADDVGQPNEMQQRATQLMAKIKQLQTPTQVNTFLKGLNKGLGATFRGTSESISKDADVFATQELNKALDKSVISIPDNPLNSVAKGFEKGGNTANTMDTYDKYIQSGDYQPSDIYKDTSNKIYQPNVAKQVISDASNFFKERGYPELGKKFEQSVDPNNLNPQTVVGTANKIISDAEGVKSATTYPIRTLKDKYSNLKSIENSLVNKAQQMARRASGGLGGGLNDYINAFNLSDAFDLITNPIGAVKAGVRAGILSKLSANKNPENLLNDVFNKIKLYRNIEKGIPVPSKGILPQIIKNTATAGITKAISPTNNIQ